MKNNQSSAKPVTYIKLFKYIYLLLFDVWGVVYKWLHCFYIIYINSCVDLFIDLFDYLVDYNSTSLIRSCPSWHEKGTLGACPHVHIDWMRPWADSRRSDLLVFSLKRDSIDSYNIPVMTYRPSPISNSSYSRKLLKPWPPPCAVFPRGARGIYQPPLTPKDCW